MRPDVPTVTITMLAAASEVGAVLGAVRGRKWWPACALLAVAFFTVLAVIHGEAGAWGDMAANIMSLAFFAALTGRWAQLRRRDRGRSGLWRPSRWW